MKNSLLGAILLALFAVGCAMPHTTVENSKQLRIGMTKAQVLEIMGEPLSDEAFCQPNVWYYYIETVWADALVTEDECLPLVFSEGRLIGWGRHFYNEYRIRSASLPQVE
ncbi:MAG: DUF3192 domain-containing protein [Victivallaceae bacterium]|nr:DUF3192 domain-containing protein [Victivallaceae bacterium]